MIKLLNVGNDVAGAAIVVAGCDAILGDNDRQFVVGKIKKRVECDLYYIENWSFQLDLEILLRTAFAVFSSKGAY